MIFLQVLFWIIVFAFAAVGCGVLVVVGFIALLAYDDSKWRKSKGLDVKLPPRSDRESIDPFGPFFWVTKPRERRPLDPFGPWWWLG